MEKTKFGYCVLAHWENRIFRQKKIHFEKSHNAGNCERGTLWAFWNTSLLQIIQKMKGYFLETLKIFFERSHRAEQSWKGDAIVSSDFANARKVCGWSRDSNRGYCWDLLNRSTSVLKCGMYRVSSVIWQEIGEKSHCTSLLGEAPTLKRCAEYERPLK